MILKNNNIVHIKIYFLILPNVVAGEHLHPS